MRMIAYMTVIVACAVALSCSNGTSPDTTRVELDIALKSITESSLVQEIDSVSLRIRASDMQTIDRALIVSAGRVHVSLDVPPGPNRIFEMEAFDLSGRLLYAGADTVSIGQGVGQTVIINLQPQVLLMRLSPSYTEISAGMTGVLEVWIFEVDSLFGAAFRLEYDANRIRVDSAKAGDFLGSQILWYANFDDDDNLYVMSISRFGQQGQGTGVSGEGRLAKVFYTPVIPGRADISLSIARDGAPALSKPDLTAVNRYDELVLEGLNVIVRGN